MDKIFPKFKGIRAYEESETNSGEELNIKSEEQNRSPKRKSIEIDPKLKAESNEKRLKSLKDKLDFEKKQKTLVKEAINTGKRVNKRIVFDNGSDDKIDDFLSKVKTESSDKSVAKKTKNLFESDSEDDVDGEEDNKLKDFELDFDKKINDKNAEKLIELNSRFAHDSRFRIDERFLDQTEDNEEVDEVVNEKEKNLHILEEVLGRRLKPIIKTSDKKDKKSNKVPNSGLFITRFDPNNEKSAELEVKSSSTEKKSNKKVSFDEKVVDKEETKEVEVSKEVYYEVSSSLKDSLSQKEEEFSLTQIFGTSSDDNSKDKISSSDRSVEPFHEKLDNKKKKDNTRNPFKYDSSSSDEEVDEVVVKTKSDFKVKDKQKNNLIGFKFFFDKNDSRFGEDVFWDKELVQKARTNWKDRQVMIMRAMTVRKKSAKKNQKAKQKTFLKYKKNPTIRRFPKKDNKNDD